MTTRYAVRIMRGAVVIPGQIATPKKKKEEEVMISVKGDLICTSVTPIAINGLKNAISLSSKFGDVRLLIMRSISMVYNLRVGISQASASPSRGKFEYFI